RVVRGNEVSHPLLRRDRELRGVVEPWVANGSARARRGERSPVPYRAQPARRGARETREPEGGRNQNSRRLLVGTRELPVEHERRIELPGTPRLQCVAKRRLVGEEDLCEGREIGREIHERAHVEIAIGPAVESAPHAIRDRV